MTNDTGNRASLPESPRANRKLREDDAGAVKLAMLAVLEARFGYTRQQLDEAAEEIETPVEAADEVMDKVGRLRLNGRPILNVEWKTEDGKKFTELEYVFADDRIAKGVVGVVRALRVKAHELAGTPIPDDERLANEGGADGKAAVDRLAAGLEMGPRKPLVH